jgi:hypothetical protein
MISVLERVWYKKAFNLKQIWGMLSLIVCAVMVSLSDVFDPPSIEKQVSGAAGPDLIPKSEKTSV